MHAEQRRARLDLVGWATSDGAAHVLGAIPPHLPNMTVQNAAISIGSLGNLKPTAGLSKLKMYIIVITWIGA